MDELKKNGLWNEEATRFVVYEVDINDAVTGTAVVGGVTFEFVGATALV